MNTGFKQKFMIVLGWFFVILGGIGAVLPIMPTTVFLIIALAIFSKSSPRFHKMLLENRWFGNDLKQWEETKTISKKSKKKAYIIILISFGLSIVILHHRTGLQIMLFAIMLVILTIIWNIKESKSKD